MFKMQSPCSTSPGTRRTLPGIRCRATTAPSTGCTSNSTISSSTNTLPRWGTYSTRVRSLACDVIALLGKRWQFAYTAVISTVLKHPRYLGCFPASIGRNLPCRPLQRDTHTDCHASRTTGPISSAGYFISLCEFRHCLLWFCRAGKDQNQLNSMRKRKVKWNIQPCLSVAVTPVRVTIRLQCKFFGPQKELLVLKTIG